MSEAGDSWQPLTTELDRWTDAGRTATFWWRDDDAIAPTAALERMLRLVNRYRIPLGLAVIPAGATVDLVRRLANEPLVDVLQHGYAHKNHADQGERAAEFGPQRPLGIRLTELAHGWRLLENFARRTPMFVPPWNRYDTELAPGLAQQQVKVISAFGPAKQLPSPAVECNCHVDIISWRTTRGFAGVGKTVNKLAGHLQARREGALPGHETTGLLSHHLDHDDGCWSFLGELFARLDGHPSVSWVHPIEATAAEVPG
jgi:hypothetical protein